MRFGHPACLFSAAVRTVRAYAPLVSAELRASRVAECEVRLFFAIDVLQGVAQFWASRVVPVQVPIPSHASCVALRRHALTSCNGIVLMGLRARFGIRVQNGTLFGVLMVQPPDEHAGVVNNSA